MKADVKLLKALDVKMIKINKARHGLKNKIPWRAPTKPNQNI